MENLIFCAVLTTSLNYTNAITLDGSYTKYNAIYNETLYLKTMDN